MIPKRIIELALKGGWHKEAEVEDAWYFYQAEKFPAKIALDPTFYKAMKIRTEQALYFLELVLKNDTDAIVKRYE